MSLSPGTQLGVHEIIAPIGSGGMGEVYHARDTRLGRDVAIKIASEQFTERFSREARAIASLNHPNICTLYDVGPNYLVMELIDGETLRGPLPLETATAYARQIAEGLDAAHERGIIHRDLKPSNIKVTSGGVLKILDFGLAKEILGRSSSVENSPTAIETATQSGVILGTAAYMSPEQAKGKPVDKRADIWAFGVVFYEMLTGRRLFEGDSIQEILAGVIKEDPELRRVPQEVRPLLRRCLAKDPKHRLRDIGDAMPLLEDLAHVESAPKTAGWLWPSLVAVALVAAAVSVWAPWRKLPTPEITRFAITAPEATTFGPYLDLSPDGRKLAFTAIGADGQTRLWVRDMDTLTSRQLAGTQIASGWGSPFWSWDSRFIAFSDGHVLKKVNATGTAPPVTLTTVSTDVGRGTWNRDGVILFGGRGNNSPIWRILDVGGDATPVTDPKGSELHGFPFFLPDGRHFLFTRADDKSQALYVGSLDNKPEDQFSERLLPTLTQAAYVPAPSGKGVGELLFLRGTTLLTQSFDPVKRNLRGEAAPIAEGIGTTGPNSGYAFFSASTTGLLAYRTGGEVHLSWFDRDGKPRGSAGEVGFTGPVRISPDGDRYAVEASGDIWLTQLDRGVGTRLTASPVTEGLPFWSPLGDRIAFISVENRRTRFVIKASDGTGTEKSIYEADGERWLDDWSHSGQFLLYNEYASNGATDEWIISTDGSGEPTRLLDSPFDEYWAQFSPGDRWIAYQSNESGKFEVYVRAFSAATGEVIGAAYRVSKSGGERPLWRKDGRELVYVGANSLLTAVDVMEGPQFKTSLPRTLFALPARANLREFAMSPDGQRFLIPSQGNEALRGINIVANWQSGLNR